VQERVEVPVPPVILVELRTHERLEEFVVTERATVPVKPLIEVIVIIDVPGTPVFTVTLVGLAEILKSGGAAVVM